MSLIQTALDDLRAAAAKLKVLGHHAVDRVEAIVKELEGDAPALDAEAKTDAADVVKTAETQGVKPAAAEAETDAVNLGEEAAHDVEAAVTAPTAPSPAAKTIA